MEAEDWRGSEPPPQLRLELASEDEDIENPEEKDEDSDRTMTLLVTRNVYYDSVQTYRQSEHSL